MIENRIAEVLNVRFSDEDLKSCFLVDVEKHDNNRIVVYIESDDLLTIGMCQKISRFLEKQIEENEWLPERYTLDVSSPGVDNPLKLRRQYIKNKGRNASILLKDGSRLEGVLEAIDENAINLDVIKKGAIRLQFEDIKETKILVSFKKRK